LVESVAIVFPGKIKAIEKYNFYFFISLVRSSFAQVLRIGWNVFLSLSQLRFHSGPWGFEGSPYSAGTEYLFGFSSGPFLMDSHRRSLVQIISPVPNPNRNQ
jgi:hypothetical protein